MKFTALLLLAASTSAFSQTAPAPKPAAPKTGTAAAHKTARPATGATKAAAAPDEFNAPGIPKITGAPQTLYALKYVDTVIGTGALAVPRKWYTVNYTGWLTTGKKFDSSYDRNEPISFPYGAHQVISGWDTGFEGMHIGGKRRLLIPYQLAYGDQGNPTIPAKATLIFDVELLDMADTRPAPPAPPAGAEPAKPATDPAKPADPASTTPPPSME